MEPFLEREEATTTSQLVGILPGTPPKVNLVDYGTGRNGIKRHMTQQVPILDDKLFARLEAEVNIGDYICATTVNEYTEAGSRFYLAKFRRVDTITPNGADGTKSKSNGITQISTTTSVIAPLLLDTTKVHK